MEQLKLIVELAELVARMQAMGLITPEQRNEYDEVLKPAAVTAIEACAALLYL